MNEHVQSVASKRWLTTVGFHDATDVPTEVLVLNERHLNRCDAILRDRGSTNMQGRRHRK